MLGHSQGIEETCHRAPDKRAAETRSGEVWGWAGALSQHGGLGAMPPENFSNFKLKLVDFSALFKVASTVCVTLCRAQFVVII